MQAVALPPELRAAAPALAGRLGTILRDLSALIARAFLRNPARVGLTILLCNRLNRAVRRFDHLMARIAAGIVLRPPRPDPRIGTRSRTSVAPRPLAPPSAPGWLVADLRHEAMGYASQLNHLLSEPETAALLAQCPQAVRLLRPVCHMLGLVHPVLPPGHRARKPPAVPAPEPAPRREPRAVTQPEPFRAEPSFRPLHETVPCEHVFSPWLPHKAARAT